MPRRVSLPGASELFRTTEAESTPQARGRRRGDSRCAGETRPRRLGPGPARREDHRLRQQRRAAGAGAGAADPAGPARDGGRPRPDRPRGDRRGPGRPRRPRRRLRAGPPARPSRDRRSSTERRRGRASERAFDVHLDNFEGPFDLLLQLISRHKLDITEVALSQVTDEFIAHIKAAGSDWDLDQTSQFIVVAATLLDLKAARLIPSGRGRRPRGPGPAGGAGPAVRPAAAVPRVQAGGRLDRRHPGGPGPALPARRRPGAAVRPAAARGADRHQPGAVRRAGRQGDGAEAGRRGVAGPSARADGQRPRAGRAGRRPAAPAAHADLPGADRRLARPGHHGRPLPGPARAVPGGGGGLRAADPARRADHPLDRHRRRRAGHLRRVRRPPTPTDDRARPTTDRATDPRPSDESRDRRRCPARSRRCC